MSSTIGPGFSLIQSVLHPTDFSDSSLVAFNHALRASMVAKSKLTLMHVCDDTTSEWSEFPAIRETLERWGLLPKGSQKSAVADVLGIDALKIVTTSDDPTDAVIRYLERQRTDLIVLATRPREGRIPWLGKSVSAPVTRKSGEMTLLIPGDAKGFVSAKDGSVNLTNVLIPIAQSPRPEPAVNAAARFVERLGAPAGTFTVLHVGDSKTMPNVNFPELAGWKWEKDLRKGEVVQNIVRAATELKPDLIVMATDGRNGFLDGLRGSHSERLLRYGAAPLLTIPVGSRISRHLT